MKNFFILLFISAATLLAEPSFAQGWQWGATTSLNQINWQEGYMIAVDKKGNVYSPVSVHPAVFPPSNEAYCGFGPYTIVDSNACNTQLVFTCQDSSGHFQWAIGTQKGRAEPVAIATDGYHDVYAVISSPHGDSFSIAGHRLPPHQYLMKISSDGVFKWIKPCPVDMEMIRVSTSGSIYTMGIFQFNQTLGSTTLVSAGSWDVVISKFDSSMHPLWATRLGGSGDERRINSFYVCGDSSIYFSGDLGSPSLIWGADTLINTSLPSPTTYLAKLDGSGHPCWARILRSTGGIQNAIKGIVSDFPGNVYVCGQYNRDFYIDTVHMPYTATGNSFLASFDSSGNLKWHRLQDTVQLRGIVYSMSIDKCANIWVSGSGGWLHFPGPETDPAYFARYDTSGNLIDTLFLPSSGDDIFASALDDHGNLYVSSDMGVDSMIIGPDTLRVPLYVNERFFTARYRYDLVGCDTVRSPDIDPTAVLPLNDPDALQLLPNPVTNRLTIISPRPVTRVTIYNLLGKPVYEGGNGSTKTEIDVAHLPVGMYIIKVNGAELRKFLKE